jgi:pimeloyl-ACP methyl ester carboxylesterase
MAVMPIPQAAPEAAAIPHAGLDWGRHGTWHWFGLPCHWRQLGDPASPALVLLHGFGAGSGHWRRNAAPLAAAGWCVYGLDLLGFGASHQPGPRRWRPLDNRLWARQLQDFLEQVVGQAAVLVGHSLGGLVALMAAAGPPDRTPRQAPWRRRLRRWLVNLLCRLLPLELIVPVLAHSPLLGLGLQSAYRSPVLADAELLRIIARPARRPGAVGSLRAMSIAMALRPHRATAPALLSRLARPMLLIWGRQDQLVPLDVAELCRRWRPELPLVVLEDCGHCPHDEAADSFNHTLLGWLEGLPAVP